MKLLVCVFPSGELMAGDTAKVTDAEAEVRLLQMDGRYRVWEVQKDLGPDQVPAPAAKVEKAAPVLEAPAPEPAAEELEEEPAAKEAAEEEAAEEEAAEAAADEVVAPRRGRKSSR